MSKIRVRYRRAARRSYLDEEPEPEEFCDPAVRRAREAAEQAQEDDDEGPGGPGDGP